MTIKNRLIELRRERDLLADYLRCDDMMTRPMVIQISSQIGILETKIQAIEKLPPENTEEEHVEWEVEKPSRINLEIKTRPKKKKGHATYRVARTWDRF